MRKKSGIHERPLSQTPAWKDCAGFTNVELLVYFVFFSLTVGLLFHLYNVYASGRSKDATWQALEMSRGALSTFLSEQKKYPCPARLDLGPDDPGYGVADCNGVPSFASPGRDADLANGDDLVMVGAVPFKTLLDPDGVPASGDETEIKDESGDAFFFSERHTVDGWGNKLTYLVTANLTSETSYDDYHGAIPVTDETGIDLTAPAKSAHFALISHGIDGRGARTRDGGLRSPCNRFFTAPILNQTENCDHNDPKILIGLRNSHPSYYYDDSVRFIVRQTSTLWKVTGAIPMDNGTPGDTTDDYFTTLVQNANAGFVRVGGAGVPTQKLTINGALRGINVAATEICDESGTDCMPVTRLGGDDPEMKCPNPNQAIAKIESNQVFCENVFPNPITSVSCPTPGDYIAGISNDPMNPIICATP